MGKITLTARIVSGFKRLGRGTVRRVTESEFRGELAPRILRVGRQTAPSDSGRLSRGLRVDARTRGRGMEVELRSTARSAEGYPYTGVTRLGHRQPYIYPKRARALATPWGPRKRVRGYRPSHDWADDTMRAAQPHIRRSGQRIGRRLSAAIA